MGTRLRGYEATRLRGYVGTGLLRIAGHFDGPSIYLFPCFQFSICFEIPITRTLFDFFIRSPSREASLVSISETILFHWFLYLILSYLVYDPSMFIYRRSSNFIEKIVLERKHGGRDAISCLLLCVLFCMEGEFEEIISKIRLSIKDNIN